MPDAELLLLSTATGEDRGESAAKYLARLAYSGPRDEAKRQELCDACLVSLVVGRRPSGPMRLKQEWQRDLVQRWPARRMDAVLRKAHKQITGRLEFAASIHLYTLQRPRGAPLVAIRSQQRLIDFALRNSEHTDDRSFRRRTLDPARPVLHMAIALLRYIVRMEQEARDRRRDPERYRYEGFSALVAHADDWLEAAVVRARAYAADWRRYQAANPGLRKVDASEFLELVITEAQTPPLWDLDRLGLR